MERFKNVLLLNFIFVLLLSLIPVASLAASKRNDSPVNALASQSDLSMRRSRSVTVNDPETGERTVMTEEDYLCGIVAAQMPAEYDDEAIKAQAVASYTLMKYRGKNANQEAEQGFISVKEMKRTWNGDFKKNYTRLKALVHSVYGEYIAYDGQPILAAYHEFSCGRTEYGKNIWDGEFPYLVPVGSRDDICAENYRGSVRLTEIEFKRICGKKLNVVPDGDPKKWVGECVRSDSGYVMRCSICGVSINGQKLRNAFALRSACFTIKYDGKLFVFDVRGSGHGAGMSKFGANLMALNGKNYRDILAYYYSGTSIQKD